MMIFPSPRDGKTAIELLKEEELRKLVWQRHRTERKQRICAFADDIVESVRPADDKRNVRARMLEIGEEPGERDGRHVPAALIEYDDVIVCFLQAREKAPVFLVRFARLHRDDIDAGQGREAREILRDPVSDEMRLGFADREERRMQHDHCCSDACCVLRRWNCVTHPEIHAATC